MSSKQRVSALPDVPTLSEAALPGFEDGTWYGIVAPRGTPQPIVEKLNAELRRMLAQPDTQQKLLSMGLEPAGGTAAEFGTLIHSEIAKYRDIVRKANVTLD